MIRKRLRFILLAFTVALVLGVTALAYSAPKGAVESPQLTFAVGGCEQAQPWKQSQTKGRYSAKDIEIAVQGQNLSFSHGLSYVCCAELRLASQIDDRNAIAITEINDGDYCRCTCDYSIEGTFGPLAAGTYNLKVYGVEYGTQTNETYYIPPELLFQTQISVSDR